MPRRRRPPTWGKFAGFVRLRDRIHGVVVCRRLAHWRIHWINGQAFQCKGSRCPYEAEGLQARDRYAVALRVPRSNGWMIFEFGPATRLRIKQAIGRGHFYGARLGFDKSGRSYRSVPFVEWLGEERDSSLAEVPIGESAILDRCRGGWEG